MYELVMTPAGVAEETSLGRYDSADTARRLAENLRKQCVDLYVFRWHTERTRLLVHHDLFANRRA